MKRQIPQGTRVHSTDPDPLPPSSPADPGPPPNKQTARVWRDSKRRKGKTVTVIGGLQHDQATFEELLKMLKKHCGAGGTYRPDSAEIEIQGDQREVVSAQLVKMGYKVKAVGG